MHLTEVLQQLLAEGKDLWEAAKFANALAAILCRELEPLLPCLNGQKSMNYQIP